MALSEQPPAAVLLGVIQTLQAELQVQREEVARARQEAAKDRAESQREIGRLVVMVEGLTKQLDLLLRDRDEDAGPSSPGCAMRPRLLPSGPWETRPPLMPLAMALSRRPRRAEPPAAGAPSMGESRSHPR